MDLSKLSSTELLQLIGRAEAELRARDDRKEIERITQEINRRGYGFSKKVLPVSRKSIPLSWRYIPLKLHFDVKSWRRQNIEPKDWTFYGYSDNQLPWFSELVEDESELPEYSVEEMQALLREHWIGSDWHGPVYNYAVGTIYVYYIPLAIPENTERRAVWVDGSVGNVIIKNGKYLSNDKPVTNRTFMIIPDKESDDDWSVTHIVHTNNLLGINW